MKKYLIGFGTIILLHLIPYFFLIDRNMLSNIEWFLLIPDLLILVLIFTSENQAK